MDVWWFPTIFYVMIWNHPIETTIRNWLIVWSSRQIEPLHETTSTWYSKTPQFFYDTYLESFNWNVSVAPPSFGSKYPQIWLWNCVEDRPRRMWLFLASKETRRGDGRDEGVVFHPGPIRNGIPLKNPCLFVNGCFSWMIPNHIT